MFKVGDKVVKVDGSKFYSGNTVVTISKIERGIYYNQYWFKETGTWLPEDYIKLYQPAPTYEDGWTLNNGKVDIPADAKTLKDETGDIVAFKKVKAPVVREIVKYVAPSSNLQGLSHTDGRYADTTYKLIYTVTDGELTGVRLEKL